MKKKKIKEYLKLFTTSWKTLGQSFPVEFASSFAYFTLFGLPAILLIGVVTLSFFFDETMLFGEVNNQLEVVVGEDSADIIVTIASNYLEQARESILAGIFYSIVIFLLATQLIIFFQDVLNKLWQINPNFKSFWQKLLKERGLAFIMVIITGLLFFASTAVEMGLEAVVGGDLQNGIGKIVVNVIAGVLVFFWFALLYKVLPFVHVRWHPNLVGAAVTSILFFVGTWLLLEFVVKTGRLDDLYDYVAPVVLVSFWVFYNTLAFLYGAAFTRAYAEMIGEKIEAKPYAYRYKLVPEEKSGRKE